MQALFRSLHPYRPSPGGIASCFKCIRSTISCSGFMDENEELVTAKWSKITNPALLPLLFGENSHKGKNLLANLKAYFCRPLLAEIKWHCLSKVRFLLIFIFHSQSFKWSSLPGNRFSVVRQRGGLLRNDTETAARDVYRWRRAERKFSNLDLQRVPLCPHFQRKLRISEKTRPTK